MTTSTSFVQGDTEGEALEELSDDELLRRAAREVLITVALIARAMLVRAAVSVTKPAEFGLLARALAECLRAGTAVLSEQPTANPGK
jgi:hypothetical protein